MNPIQLKLNKINLKQPQSLDNNESKQKIEPNNSYISQTPLAQVFSLTPSEDMDEGIINTNSTNNKINAQDISYIQKVNLMPNIFNQLPIWATKEADSCCTHQSEHANHQNHNSNRNGMNVSLSE